MQILSAAQLRALDELTCLDDEITSYTLMNRATNAFVASFRTQFTPLDGPVLIVCGSGNNGGDGFVAARLLHAAHYKIHIISVMVGERSTDNEMAYRAARAQNIPLSHLTIGDPLPTPAPDVILIDALFGTGLSRPVLDYWADLIIKLNQTEDITRVALDIPSGLPTDRPALGVTFRADHTITLGYPKAALFAAENSEFVGKMRIATFKLSPVAAILHVDDDGTPRPDEILTEDAIASLVAKRGPSDHKGTYGHALLIAGSFGKMGAAVIAARAVLRSGAGLVTCHIPRSGYEIMQISFPEAMCTVDAHRYHTTEVGDLSTYKTIGIGPGLRTEALTVAALRDVLTNFDRPVVIDADALNIIAANPALLDLVPEGSILTPHPKEFERLFGEMDNSFARWRVQGEVAKSRGLVVLCKTNHTSIALPSGEIYLNTTGNPGMGTAGTGDALTGILTGLLAQGYASGVAAKLGVYLHGLAGDLAAEELSQPFLLAEDVVNHIGAAYRELTSDR